MVQYDFNFDPVRDLQPVDQFGFIDLKSALDTGVVPSNLPDSDSDYNGIDDPEKVLGSPRDVFEALDAQNILRDAAAAANLEGGEDE